MPRNFRGTSVNEKFRELMSQAISGLAENYSTEDFADKFAELLFDECVNAVENTPTHCAYTTYQLGIVECTIDKSVETLYTYFDKKRTFKLKAPL